MIEELLPNIYMTEIPLRNNPLKYLNCYFIKSTKGNMIIDTGFNDEESRILIEESMKELGFTYDNTVLFLTHAHSDHVGLAGYFSDKGMEVYISKADGDIVNGSVAEYDSWWERTVKLGIQQGLGPDHLYLKDHPGFKFRPTEKVDFKYLEDGEVFDMPPYKFEVVDLRGHSPGIKGLYDKEKKIFFCGDHILGNITPNITYWGPDYGDALGYYFKNLKKVKNMEIDHLFSSHRQQVTDVKGRIEELFDHHEKRLEETREALKKHGKATVRMVTKNLHWDIRSKSWDDFPKAQKWFAAGEAHAHLEHLRAVGEVVQEEVDGVLYFSLVEAKKEMP